MRIKEETEKYEAWLARHIKIVKADLDLKHTRMTESPFLFLRATFYRWAQVWPKICPDLAKAPLILAVGDLHVENFGTWRDIEGRLIWGVNDFDEAYPMAYTNDLVRLAISAHLAIAGNHLAIKVEDACSVILEGYRDGIESGGKPFVLEEGFKWLRETAMGELRDPVHFWGKMNALPTIRGDIAKSAKKALEASLPTKGLAYRIAHRTAGVGSLGHERFVAIADWGGASIAREAKALVPSACVWANGSKGPQKISYEEIMTNAVRVHDPFVHTCGGWIVRRLAPHCSRIELTSLPQKRDEERLLHAMGYESANIHLGSRDKIKAVRSDLAKRKPGWLHEAVKVMTKSVIADWEDWKAS